MYQRHKPPQEIGPNGHPAFVAGEASWPSPLPTRLLGTMRRHKHGCVSWGQCGNCITVVTEFARPAPRFCPEAAHNLCMRRPTASRCLCCGYRTLAVPEALELCQVCWWQDDGQDDRDADVIRRTVNGNLSLSEGRRNYKHYQAADPRFVAHVRTPRQEEL